MFDQAEQCWLSIGENDDGRHYGSDGKGLQKLQKLTCGVGRWFKCEARDEGIAVDMCEVLSKIVLRWFTFTCPPQVESEFHPEIFIAQKGKPRPRTYKSDQYSNTSLLALPNIIFPNTFR